MDSMNDATEQVINPILARRELIKSEPAPHPRHDVIVTLKSVFDGKTLRLRYVPDRDVILITCLDEYLDAVSNLGDDTLEAVSQIILEDFNDQVIPSWLEVTLTAQVGTFSHQVQVEDRQPYWKDRGLLDRLAP